MSKVSSVAVAAGKRATSTSCAAVAAAATGEPVVAEIGRPYDSKRPSNAWMASCIATWTMA